MKIKFICGVLLLMPPLAGLADNRIQIQGSPVKVIEVTPEASTGLNNIFVVRNMTGCSIVYTASRWIDPKVYRYSNLGGGYAEEITNVEKDAPRLIIPNAEGDMGYIIEDGDFRYYFWVVNYNNHVFSLNSVTESSESDCDYTRLNIEGNTDPINYYTINGQQRVLSREIYLDYTNQEFDSNSNMFVNTDVRKVYESLTPTVSISPPLYCASYFVVTGDRFQKEWGEQQKAESKVINPIAVDCKTEAQQTYYDFPDGSNIINGDGGSSLGGSAPAEITFYAYATEGVIHHEWQLSRESDFKTIDNRFNQQDVTYTFNEEGSFYMRYIGSNADGSCESFSDTYTISIGASDLVIPNAFSPNGDGVNDIWKVSYRSLIEFHCEIFNRNGQLMYSFSDPNDGWDGTFHGKKVKSGVYYYVIIAKGADGRKYKKSGDINIIIHNSRGPATGGGTDDPTDSLE